MADLLLPIACYSCALHFNGFKCVHVAGCACARGGGRPITLPSEPKAALRQVLEYLKSAHFGYRRRDNLYEYSLIIRFRNSGSCAPPRSPFPSFRSALPPSSTSHKRKCVSVLDMASQSPQTGSESFCEMRDHHARRSAATQIIRS